MVSNKISSNHLSTKSVKFHPFTVMQHFHLGIITQILMLGNINEHHLNVRPSPYFTYLILLDPWKIDSFLFLLFHFSDAKSKMQSGQGPGHHTKWMGGPASIQVVWCHSPNTFTTVFSSNHFIFLRTHFLTSLHSSRHS